MLLFILNMTVGLYVLTRTQSKSVVCIVFFLGEKRKEKQEDALDKTRKVKNGKHVRRIWVTCYYKIENLPTTNWHINRVWKQCGTMKMRKGYRGGGGGYAPFPLCHYLHSAFEQTFMKVVFSIEISFYIHIYICIYKIERKIHLYYALYNIKGII